MASRQIMLKGTLDMIVLQILVEQPLHGYAITRRIQKLTDEVFLDGGRVSDDAHAADQHVS